MLNGGHKSAIAFDWGDVELLVELIEDVDVEVAILIEKHLISFLNRIKVITFVVVDETIQILSGNLLSCAVISEQIQIKLIIG